MFHRILLTALIAGVLAGLFVSVVQAVRVVPLIHLAETYEAAPTGHDLAGHAGDDHADAGWVPEGAERIGFTVLANVLTGVGFALTLVAAFALWGRRTDWRVGVLWGLAGFAAFSLAPALGLPPELPGSAAADLHARQGWWLAAAAATAGGIALIALQRRRPLKLAGAGLILLPHLLGAPHPEGAGLVPPELAAQYAIASLVTMAMFWTVLGGVAGHVFARLGRG